MRRTTTILIALAATLSVPTTALAASPSLDPDGESLLAALAPWADSLGSLLLTYLGI